MARILGGDVVGMSTVPETIVVAKQCGLTVTGLACVTNYGCGITDEHPNHEDVSAMAKRRAPEFFWLLESLVGIIDGA
jgi:purine-nucleoside phosphorylase